MRDPGNKHVPAGRYLYCIARGKSEGALGPVGIEGSTVCVVAHQGLCGVVHGCEPKPYVSQNQERVRRWVLAHQRVVETAWTRFGDVLPCRFNTILQDNGALGPEATLRAWLATERRSLEERLARVSGKAEYGVKLFWNPQAAARRLMNTNESLKNLRKRMDSVAEGTAYILKQKLDEILKMELQEKSRICCGEVDQRVRECVAEVHTARVQEADGESQMILNRSCLAGAEQAKALGKALDGITLGDDFSVQFTGPWPPYSFS